MRGFLAGAAPPPKAAPPVQGEGVAAGAGQPPPQAEVPDPADSAAADQGPPLHDGGAEGEPDPALEAAVDGDPDDPPHNLYFQLALRQLQKERRWALLPVYKFAPLLVLPPLLSLRPRLVM